MLEGLAASRGTTLEAVAEAAPLRSPDEPWTADELAAGAWGGFGSAVDEVQHLVADERERVFEVFAADFDDLRRALFPPTEGEGGA